MIHTCKQHFDHVHGFYVGVSVVFGFELVIVQNIKKFLNQTKVVC